MLQQLKPFIPAGPDFQKAKRFFADLGFKLDWEAPGLAQLSLGGAVFLLQDYNNREMQDNLMMYVTVADLDEWWRHIQKSGVLEKYPGVKAKEPTIFPWGAREIHLIDPAGVCWHFA